MSELEKIKWYQSRWFWGAVLGVIIIGALTVLYGAANDLHHTFFSSVYAVFQYISFGFLFIIQFLFIRLLHLDLYDYILSLGIKGMLSYYVLYILILSCSAYVTFKKKKVNILFFLLLFLLCTLSFIGSLVIAFVDAN